MLSTNLCIGAVSGIVALGGTLISAAANQDALGRTYRRARTHGIGNEDCVKIGLANLIFNRFVYTKLHESQQTSEKEIRRLTGKTIATVEEYTVETAIKAITIQNISDDVERYQAKEVVDNLVKGSQMASSIGRNARVNLASKVTVPVGKTISKPFNLGSAILEGKLHEADIQQEASVLQSRLKMEDKEDERSINPFKAKLQIISNIFFRVTAFFAWCAGRIAGLFADDPFKDLEDRVDCFFSNPSNQDVKEALGMQSLTAERKSSQFAEGAAKTWGVFQNYSNSILTRLNIG